MSYELNARITLPTAMNNSQICELNVGRYQNLDFCRDDLNKAEASQPAIVSYVIHGLSMYYDVEAEEGELVPMFEVSYFIRAV